MRIAKEGAGLKRAVIENCELIAEQNPPWQWMRSKQNFKNKVFKDTSLIIDPVFRFQYRVVMEPWVFIENKTYSKVLKLCGLIPQTPLWLFTQQEYYRRTETPTKYHIYETVHTDQFDHYHTPDKIPWVISSCFNAGKKIFDDKMDMSSEEALLRNLVDPLEGDLEDMVYCRHLMQLTITAQAILRLLFLADKNFAETALEKYDKLGGSHRKHIPLILPHMDEIIAMSPYL